MPSNSEKGENLKPLYLQEQIRTLDDRDLIEMAKEFDPDAFFVLYERYYHNLYSYIYARMKEPQLAEELTDDIFIRAWMSLPRYEDRGYPFSVFLFCCAKNRMIDQYYRDKSCAPQLELNEKPISQRSNLYYRVVENDVLDKICQDELFAQVLPLLTQSQRQVVNLKAQGFSNSEIAEQLEMTEGAVKSMYHRAVGTMGRYIRDNVESRIEESSKEKKKKIPRYVLFSFTRMWYMHPALPINRDLCSLSKNTLEALQRKEVWEAACHVVDDLARTSQSLEYGMQILFLMIYQGLAFDEAVSQIEEERKVVLDAESILEETRDQVITKLLERFNNYSKNEIISLFVGTRAHFLFEKPKRRSWRIVKEREIMRKRPRPNTTYRLTLSKEDLRRLFSGICVEEDEEYFSKVFNFISSTLTICVQKGQRLVPMSGGWIYVHRGACVLDGGSKEIHVYKKRELLIGERPLGAIRPIAKAVIITRPSIIRLIHPSASAYKMPDKRNWEVLEEIVAYKEREGLE